MAHSAYVVQRYKGIVSLVLKVIPSNGERTLKTNSKTRTRLYARSCSSSASTGERARSRQETWGFEVKWKRSRDAMVTEEEVTKVAKCEEKYVF